MHTFHQFFVFVIFKLTIDFIHIVKNYPAGLFYSFQYFTTIIFVKYSRCTCWPFRIFCLISANMEKEMLENCSQNENNMKGDLFHALALDIAYYTMA